MSTEDSPKFNWKLLLKIGVSLALLALFVWMSDLEKLLTALQTANLWYVPVGVVVYLFSQWLSAYRWQFLAAPMGFQLPLSTFYAYYLMGMFFSLFLPGSIGGDVGRVYYLAKAANKRKREASLTLLAERGVGLLALLILTGSLCLLPATSIIPWAVKLPIILLAGAMFLGLSLVQCIPFPLIQGVVDKKLPKLSATVSWMSQAEVYWKDTPLLLKSVSYSMMVHLLMVALHLVILHALGVENIPLLYLVAVYGLVTLASVLPIAFNGLGVREGAYVYFFSLIGIPTHEGLAIGLYWFLISALTSLVGGLVFMKVGMGSLKTLQTEASIHS